ncbi:hypothetical protein LAY57_16280 [Argonema antarcticum A004/B2]|nr:hypothetical protein [Argonema antarcticum A004/B2]
MYTNEAIDISTYGKLIIRELGLKPRPLGRLSLRNKMLNIATISCIFVASSLP